MQTLVRAIATLATVMSVLGIALLINQAFAPKLDVNLPRGVSSPGLAIEFASSLDDVKTILGERRDQDSMREKIRKALYGDYLFIAMYWLLFVGLSALLIVSGRSWAMWAGVIAAVCAMSAAIFDVVENLSIAALIDAAEVRNEMIRNVASAGFGKWLSVFVATLIISLLFARRNWLALLGVLFLLIGVLGIYGLLQNQPRLVELAFRLYFLGVIAVAIVFTFFRRKILEQL